MAKKKQRLTKYDTHVKPKLVLVEGWARDGLTDEQIANNLGVAYSTFRVYRDKHPALSAVLKKGKEVVDIEVENALLKKALGFKETVKKVKVTNDGFVINYEEEVYLPPDTTAQIFWLKNRRPDKWRDRKDIEHSGDMSINNPFANMSTKDLEALAAELNKGDG